MIGSHTFLGKRVISMKSFEDAYRFQKKKLSSLDSYWALGENHEGLQGTDLFLLDVTNLAKAQTIQKGSRIVYFDKTQIDLRAIVGTVAQPSFGYQVDPSGLTNYFNSDGLAISGLGLPSEAYFSHKYQVKKYLGIDQAIWDWFISNLRFYKLSVNLFDPNLEKIGKLEDSRSQDQIISLPSNFEKIRDPLLELIRMLGESHITAYQDTSHYQKLELGSGVRWNLRSIKIASHGKKAKVGELVVDCKIGRPLQLTKNSDLEGANLTWLASRRDAFFVTKSSDLVMADEGDVITNLFWSRSSARIANKRLALGPGLCALKPKSPEAATSLLEFLNSHEASALRYLSTKNAGFLPQISSQDLLDLDIPETKAHNSMFASILSKVIV